MDGWGVLAGVVVVGIAAIAAVIFQPWREWGTRKIRQATGGYGLAIHQERDPALVAEYHHFPVHFFFPDQSPIPAPPASHSKWWAWAHQLGGQDVGMTSVMLTFQATAEVALVIDPPIVHVRDYEVPKGGVVRVPEGVGNGFMDPRQFTVDLDLAEPSAVYRPEVDDPRSPSFSLSLGGSARIQILASCERADRAWWLEVPVIANGVRRQVAVGTEDDPFVTIAPVGKRFSMYTWESDPAEAVWIDVPNWYDG